MPTRPLYTLLACAGALPFLAAALLPLVGINSVPFAGSLTAVAASYGLAIASFMAGTHWGLFLGAPKRSPVNLFLSSNAVVLLVWFAYLSGHMLLVLSVQMIAFALLLAVDLRLSRAGIIEPDYFRVRAIVTVMVLVSLGVVLVTRPESSF